MSDLQKLIDAIAQRLHQADPRLADPRGTEPKAWDELVDASKAPYVKMALIAAHTMLKAVRTPSAPMIQAGCKAGWPEFPLLKPEMQKMVVGMVQASQQAGFDALIAEIERGGARI